jgi:gamma-glutamyltranspeptidase/glutathione hydrolase
VNEPDIAFVIGMTMAISARAVSFVSMFFAVAPVYAVTESLPPAGVRFAREGLRGMVVADDQQAAEWGAEVLRKGGNAIDAAVATAFAMAVTRPHYAALGGGGFLVFCPKSQNNSPSTCKVIDFREKAPAAATRDMYIRNGKADTQLSQNGALASGVPGVTAGLMMALEKFGNLKRQVLLAEPIRLARKGIRVSTNTGRALHERWDSFNAEAKSIFSCGRSELRPCLVGDTLRQPDLAAVLEAVSKRGAAGFYQGIVAKKVAAGLRSAGGIITLKDLADYAPSERQPVRGEFRGHEVITMPPPSSGGAVLVQMLGYIERADKQGLLKNGYASIDALQTQIHAMSLAFADRAAHMGDSDFYPVPLARLLAADYLDERWKTFQPNKAMLPDASGFSGGEKMQTTHFSVIDAEGNAAAITETVNGNFGSGFVPAGTGIVMNNQMDDFSTQPGVPNMFGLIGGEANAIAPHKRPLSSMSPTIIRDNAGAVRLVLGAAGGPRIITSVFQSLVNRLQFEMNLADAVGAPRIHHQWRPQTVRFERNGFATETIDLLRRMGYQLEAGAGLAVVHALERFPSGRVTGVPDPRGEGFAAAE